jgi:hypothetical protein
MLLHPQSFDDFKIGDLDSRGYAYIGRHMDSAGSLKHWFTTSARTPFFDITNRKYTFDKAAEVLSKLCNSTSCEWQLPTLELLSFMIEQRHLGALRDSFKPSRLDWILSSTFENTISPNGRIKYPNIIAVARAKDGTVSYTDRSTVKAEIRPVFSVSV